MYFEDLHGTNTSQQYDIIYVSIPLKYRLQTFIYSNVDTTKTVYNYHSFTLKLLMFYRSVKMKLKT